MPARRFDDELTFLEHLDELRDRLIKCVIGLGIGFLLGWFLAPWPLEWLTLPLETSYSQLQDRQERSASPEALQIMVEPGGQLRLMNQDALTTLTATASIHFYQPGTEHPVAYWRGGGRTSNLIYIRPMDPFLIRLKAAAVLALIFSLPIILYQAWAFIAPGMMENERRFVLPVIVAGSVLFPAGAIFAYFLLDITLRFFTQFTMSSAAPLNDASAYLRFVLGMMLAFGAVFELPIAVVLATRAGLVEVQWLAERRKVIFVILLGVAAVLTPSGDPITLLALSGPLYLLFEGSLIVSRLLDRAVDRRQRNQSAEATEAENDNTDPRPEA